MDSLAFTEERCVTRTGLSATSATLGTLLTVTPSVAEEGGSAYYTEFKWLHEFEAKRRPEGDILFLKALMKF